MGDASGEAMSITRPLKDDAEAGEKFPSREASDVLVSHWQNGTTLKELPDRLRPTTISQGYEIQKHLMRLTSSPLWGWKIAATSVHGQRHINSDRPLAGHVLAERITPYGEKVPLGNNRMLCAELELAFRIGRDIEPRGEDEAEWEVEEVMDAVDGLFLGSELPDSRFEDFVGAGVPSLIADNACGDRYVLGPEVKDWRGKDLVEHKIRGWIEGIDEVREGKGGNVLGDPRIAMAWIANELGRYGMMLRKGEYVTTGTCVFPFTIRPGDKLVGDYGDFGRLEVEFTE